MKLKVVSLLLILFGTLNLKAIDFGLRFQSHTYASEERSSLNIGDTKLPFSNQFKLGFFFSIYSSPMFGNVATITTDDGQCISVVISRHDDGTFNMGLVINDEFFPLYQPLELDINKTEHVELLLNKDENTATLLFNERELKTEVDLSKTKSATFIFGMGEENKQAVAAPFDLRNIRVFTDNRNTHHWDLKYHDSDSTSIDNLGNVTAYITNPHWLIDDHSDWRKIFSEDFADNIQTAFNPKDEIFYIVGDKEIIKYNPLKDEKEKISIKGGTRLVPFSNYLHFDTLNNRLINYNLNTRNSVFMDLDKKVWLNQNLKDKAEEANYANHAFAVDDNKLYSFGGYGFYKYHNDFFILDLQSGDIKKPLLYPEMMPMTSSAAAVVNNKLYIFGGKGNETGKQELPVKYNYALYEYDTDTWRGRKVWELDSIVNNDFIPSQSMFYELSDDSFYLASTDEGGQMVKLSRQKPEMTIVSTNIGASMSYFDFVFDLYKSSDGKRYYLVLDKRIDRENHDYAIYTINTPFLNKSELDIIRGIQDKTGQLPSNNKRDRKALWIPLGIFLLLIVICFIIFISRRRLKSIKKEEKQDPEIYKVENSSEMNVGITEFFKSISIDKKVEFSNFYNRNVSAISLLGHFNVRSASGEDITGKFTSKIKGLLVLLLIECKKYEDGVTYQTINEVLWDDKDEKSAQNNRNVTLRKLRKLLEEVGDINVSYDRGLFKIDSEDVFVDYYELLSQVRNLKDEDIAPEQVNKILELLLMGPLLPDLEYAWLDSYKASYSEKAMDILNKLMKYEFGKNDELAFRIAETMTLHESLCEEAMIVKCQILYNKKMIALSQNQYSKFCKEYQNSLGEKYPLSYSQVLKKAL